MNSQIPVQILIFGYLFPLLVGHMHLYINMVLAGGHAHISMVSYTLRTRNRPYPGPVNSRHLRYSHYRTNHATESWEKLGLFKNLNLTINIFWIQNGWYNYDVSFLFSMSWMLFSKLLWIVPNNCPFVLLCWWREQKVHRGLLGLWGVDWETEQRLDQVIL